MKTLNRKICKAWPSVALALFLVVFYYKFITGKVFGGDDLLYQFFPGAQFFAKSIASGVFPYWLPGQQCGMPFYSDVQMGVFYPLKWLLVLFVRGGELSQTVYQNYLVFQYLIGGTCFYALMRRHKTSQPAALIGALVFLFSGFSALHVIFFASVEVYLWLPLVLISIHYFIEKRSFDRLLLISFAVLLMILPGFPQVTLYLSYLAVAYWLVMGVTTRFEQGKRGCKLCSGVLVDLALIVFVYFFAALMGAASLLPAFENWKLSHRAEYGYDEIADTSVPFYYLVHLFFPNVTGIVNASGDAVPFWGFNRDTIGFQRYNTAYWHYWDMGIYAGQVGIAAFLYAGVRIRLCLKEKGRLLALLGAVLSLWFMLGRYGGLFEFLYNYMPGVDMFRGPGRMSCVFHVAVAMLSAFMIQDLFDAQRRRFLRWFLAGLTGLYVVACCVFVVKGAAICSAYENQKIFQYSLKSILTALGVLGGITGLVFLLDLKRSAIWRGSLAAGLALLCFFDLYAAHNHFHQGHVKSADYFSDKNELIARLGRIREQVGPFRFAQVRNGQINESVVLPRNISFFHDEMEVPEGYVLFNLSAYKKMRTKLDYQTQLDLLNIGVVAEANGRQVSVRAVQPFFPRVRFYEDYAFFDSNETALDAVADKKIDYKQTIALLESDRFVAAPVSGGADATVSIKKLNNNAWTISYDAVGPGVIFVSQVYYPGWVAEADNGGELEVVEAFGGLTGIVLPEAGTGRIRFQFKPASFRVGLWISSVSIGLALMGFGLLRRRACVRSV